MRVGGFGLSQDLLPLDPATPAYPAQAKEHPAMNITFDPTSWTFFLFVILFVEILLVAITLVLAVEEELNDTRTPAAKP